MASLYLLRRHVLSRSREIEEVDEEALAIRGERTEVLFPAREGNLARGTRTSIGAWHRRSVSLTCQSPIVR
jgi:seryl-tRNA synthetase